MTIHVFRYSQLIDTNSMLAIKVLATASRLLEEDIASIAFEEETEEDGIISRYKRGKIDDKTFRQELNKAIVQKGGTKLEDDVFDDCWNAMCTVDSSKMSKLHQLQLKHEGCKIHIIGDTNALQHEFIIKKIASLEKKPEIDYTLSFKEYTSNRKALEELVKKAYPDVEIVWYNTEQENSLEELLTEYYDSSEESSLVEQDITGKVVEDSTNESSKSLVEDTIPVMGGLELSSNHDSIE